MNNFKVFNEQVFFYINKKRRTWGTLTNNPRGMPSEQALSMLLRIEPDDLELIAVVSESHLTADIRAALEKRTDEIAMELFK